MADAHTMDKRGGRMRVGLVVAGVLLLVGSAAGGAVWLLRRSTPPEPLATLVNGPLPGKVSALGQTAQLDPLEQPEVPAAIDRSSLASLLCGGVDVAQRLFDAKGETVDELGPEVLDLFANEKVAPALRCAARVYPKIRRHALLTLAFEGDDDADRQVALLAGDFRSLPMAAHSFRGLAGYCRRDPKSGDCDQDGFAAVRRHGMWATGKFAAVQALAREWTSERKTATTDVQIVRDLTAALEPADAIRLFVKPDHVVLSSACFAVAPPVEPLAFAGKCWPDDVGDTMKSISAEVRGYAVEQDFPLRSGKLRTDYVLLARDEREAEDLERDVDDLIRDWRARLENQKANLIQIVRKMKDERAEDAYEAQLEAFLRAADGMKAERHGRVVRLRLEEPLREGERKAIAAGLGRSAADLHAAAQVVEALEAGNRPPEKAVARFVGQDAATWMLLPRASKDDCKAIHQHFDELVARGVPTEQFGAKFRVSKWLDGGKCAGMPLPASRRACLTGASDLAAMDACPSPLTPGQAWARRVLEGQWRVTKVSVKGDDDGSTTRVLEGSRFEFGKEKVAWATSGHRVMADHRADAAADGEVSFRWPSNQGPFVVEAKPSGDGTLHVAPDDGSFEVVLERAHFDRSLLAAAQPSGGQP